MALKGVKLNLGLKKSDSKAVSKTAKISEAQQYTLLAVFCASVFLGVAIALVIRFVNQISFNASVIAEEEQTIVTLSDTIKNVGICAKPKGSIYTDEELKRCRPNDIDVASVPGTLRSNILQNMAANVALNSVPKEDLSYCVNSSTGKNFTYSELNDFYNEAAESEDTQKITAATELIQICSALRIIPDALPSYRNEEALLSSLNRVFIISNWDPEGLSPTGSYEPANFGSNLYTIPFQLSVDADATTTMTVLYNIERSIREFNIKRASIEYDSSLTLNAEFTAYYTTPATVTEGTKTLKPGVSTNANTKDKGASK